ncbi:MAG: response regulator [Candidatus Omnitrophota bacterium]
MTPRKRILIVDDEEDFLRILRDSMELRGIEVVLATSAVEAGLELATKLPDLILMDVKMPGINGLQACEAIKRNPATKDLPIIIVSALSDESDIKRAYAVGVVDYFIKPIDIEKLVKRVREILGL